MENDHPNQHEPARSEPSRSSQTVSNSRTPQWERDVLERLAFATLKEQRARRRWNIFLRLLTLSLIVTGIWLAFMRSAAESQPLGQHTALIEINGTIESQSNNSAENVIPALNRAYADENAVGVVIRINSPGGSPVQAGMINDEIARLRKIYPNKPLYVVVEEICASGGYYIAAAADKIFVNRASIVGSIGVLMDGFGLAGLMEKLGVERRLLTAGENKGFMDPFSPQSPQQKSYAQDLLNEVHRQFIEVVRQGRGDRLKETPETFSGLFWIGSKAVEIGLADAFGTVDTVARDELKAEEVVDYTQYEGLSERLLKKFGGAVGEAAVSSLWSKSQFSIR